MTVSDPNRAAFVTNEYRYATPTPAYAVKARNPSSRDITIETQIDAASAAAIASKYLAENSLPRAFEFEIADILTPDDFVGGPPSFILEGLGALSDGRTLKIVSASVNETAGTTLVQVRG
ncbi:hypothetical protein [Sphingomonas sp. G-3-2-10]|uniref:hypothetical protein n=1 Tax=Sphingomonas sp. G-3-2-10 TaxID=2728838 RepID=UPI00146EB855|nr:hypothetical protein [Sphingomonas sp. G-3-2-10]NML04266.1 hypothetical protein [Sphingomonas sp. G-3-2-10]